MIASIIHYNDRQYECSRNSFYKGRIFGHMTCHSSSSNFYESGDDSCTFHINSKTETNAITRLGRPFGLQEVEAPKISRRSAHEGGKDVSPTHRQPLPPRHIPGTHFC
jgi:hypothetical protein